MEKLWSKAEVAHLKRNAEKQSVEELAQRFHADSDTVRRKLEELGLGGMESSNEATAAVLGKYGQALELLYAQEYAKAAELFEQIVAEADDMQIADRAQQHLDICRARTDGDSGETDPYLIAVFEKNNGNLDQALEVCQQQDASDSDERYAYLMASIQALAGAEDEALGLLESAIRLEPKNRVHAFHDPDFDELRGNEDFVQLVQASSAAE